MPMPSGSPASETASRTAQVSPTARGTAIRPQLERILQEYDSNWQVDNFGVSGATLLHNGDRPYIQESAL